MDMGSLSNGALTLERKRWMTAKFPLKWAVAVPLMLIVIPLAAYYFMNQGINPSATLRTSTPENQPTIAAATSTLPSIEATAPGITEEPLPLPSLTGTPTAQAETPGVDKALFIGETYPDNTPLKPNESFTKTWTIKNVGTTTWDSAYRLVMSAAPEGDTLGSPQMIPFPTVVKPEESVELSIPLTAPQKPGSYSVFWQLENGDKKVFSAALNTIWTKISVCPVDQACDASSVTENTSNNPAIKGVAAQFVQFDVGDNVTSTKFCLSFPSNSRNWGPGPGSIALMVDGKTMIASRGGTDGSPTCYTFEFTIAKSEMDGAKSIMLSIGNVRILGGGNGSELYDNCIAARPQLMARYPGLNFVCEPLEAFTYYSNLTLPPNLTKDKANQIIVDAVEQAIYGPWILQIR